MAKTSWDAPENEVQSNWVKFNVPMEDKIKGTLIDKRQQTKTKDDGTTTKQWVYELKADEGSYHALDEKLKVIPDAITVVEGGFYSVGGTAVLDRGMKNVMVGQKVGLKFIEEQPAKTKGHHPAKIIKVYTFKNEDGSPLMDTDWMNQQAVDNFSGQPE